MKKRSFIIRQGDVLIESISTIPTNLQKQKPVDGRVILAYGEVTGHHHSIESAAADWWKGGCEDQFVEVKTATKVVHQEHGPIDLPKGKYRVRRQREYTPAALRNVAD